MSSPSFSTRKPFVISNNDNLTELDAETKSIFDRIFLDVPAECEHPCAMRMELIARYRAIWNQIEDRTDRELALNRLARETKDIQAACGSKGGGCQMSKLA